MSVLQARMGSTTLRCNGRVGDPPQNKGTGCGKEGKDGRDGGPKGRIIVGQGSLKPPLPCERHGSDTPGMTLQSIISAAIVMTAMSVCAHAQTRSGLAGAEIVFLDVGQGDAILLRSDTFAVLIDAGGNGIISEELRDLGVEHLHLAIASHNHRDHIGGMDEVLYELDVDHYIDNGCYGFSDTQDVVNQAVGDRDIPSDTAWDTTFVFGAMRLRILPSPLWTASCSVDQNNLSVGVLVEVGKFQALLTGDSQKEELSAWLTQGIIPDVTLIKAGHHGSENGVTPGWIHVTRPEVVVISVGRDNSYRHPSEVALRYYRTGGRRVLRTDRDGTIGVCIEPTGEYEVKPHLEQSGAVCK